MVQKEPADLEGAVLAVAAVGGPAAGAEAAGPAETQAHQQQVGQGQDQEQPVEPPGPGQARVTQAPAVAFALGVSEELLDAHAAGAFMDPIRVPNQRKQPLSQLRIQDLWGRLIVSHENFIPDWTECA